MYNNQTRWLGTYSTPLSYYRHRLDPHQQQRQQLAAHAAEAQQRAMELLLSNLTPGQRETFKANKWFIVEGGKTKRRYRINDKGHLIANIDVLNDNGRVAHRLCGHSEVKAIPLGDHLLAQKIMLEEAEEDFLRVANWHAA